MPMEASAIEALIKAALPDAQIELKDLVGDKDHYAAIIRSEAFRGKNRIMQHRMVYKALGERVGGELHALTLTTEAL